MIVLTGGAGFIGSCLLAQLNQEGFTDVIVVDHLNHPLKKRNLEGKKFTRYFEKAEFLNLIRSSRFPGSLDAVIHMGACSSTTLEDAHYYETNNFKYSKTLAQWALPQGARFIYASSAATYGDGHLGYDDSHAGIPALKPLNLYGLSKQKFDLWLLETGALPQCVGLKFFNVFGPNEYHKGDMRSVILKSYPLIVQEGRIALFKSYVNDYGDGEQKRDFIYVKDAVDVVLFFLKASHVSGIFNVGSGQARTWNDLARAIFDAVGKKPVITYMDMPLKMRDKYQYFTQARMEKLRQAGYVKPFTPLETAVADYVGYLKEERHL